MDFLGTGLQFPLTIDEAGGVALSGGEENIRESLRIILSTAKGERVMRPDFGCDLNAMVFSVINSSSVTLIKSAVREAILRFEPRVELNSVSVSTEKLNEGILVISLFYRVIQTNNEYNLVYPFAVGEGG